MKIVRVVWKPVADRAVAFVCLVVSLFVIQLVATWPVVRETAYHLAGDALFAAGLLTAVDLSRFVGLRFGSVAEIAWVIGGLALAVVLYGLTQGTLAAWVLIVATCVLLTWLDREVSAALFRRRLSRWVTRVALSVAGAFVPIIFSQIESRFAEEEFFVLLQAVALIPFCMLFLVGQERFYPDKVVEPVVGRVRTWSILALVGFAVVMMGLVVWGVVVYQASFYSRGAPDYPGVTTESPFVCGQVLPDPAQQPSGVDVYRRLLALVEANPRKGPPEYGMLAVGTGEQHWAQAFRESLLNEAGESRFTEPAHSVKWGQYESALRAYYLPRVHEAFPGLFSDEDWALLRDWFAELNERALTVEWVDWMYGLAFTKWPEGLYENQENGAGLLALLESEGLAAPSLSLANREYLDRNRRGWTVRFRNTDDAMVYQPEWINNALFQSLYTGEIPEDHSRFSFEWLLLQALPDGAPFGYNHPTPSSLAGIAYMGALLLEDPRYVWLADQAAAKLEAEGGYLFAQPGIEGGPTVLEGRSPTQGSCLLYGDSGLPNQVGPLAPDKIVLRDGWGEDATYLLLNLRFTGWHRYKATNTISLIYQDGPLAADALDQVSLAWLPVGRSVLRDKRIPRESLNGLLVERSGMSAVLHALSGIGGRWAQDPPHYAEVVAFATASELDWAHTRLADWRGWQHDRWVYLYHDGGPIVVVDEAEGPVGGQAALTWHLVGGEIVEPGRIQLRGGAAEVAILPSNSGGRLATETRAGDSGLSVVYYAPAGGQLQVLTLCLLGGWVGAEAQVDWVSQTLCIEQGQERLCLSLDPGA